tara:strand:+ start:1721 stop:2677 length:957 start_codon:yes stop_codon:yes gene_type:complete
METFETHTGHNFLTKEKVEHPMDAHVVMREAGALFDVAYPPSGYENSGFFPGEMTYPMVKSGVNKGTPLHKYVIRTDTNDVLGLHSHKYAETDGYRYIADMAEELFPGKTTSCTVFGVGEKIAVTQELVAPIDLGEGDFIQPQICWVTSYNGVWPTAVYDLTERLFCQNQLVGMPLVKVKHTKNHDSLLEMRVRILEGSIARAEALANMARVLRDQEFTDEQFAELVQEVLPLTADMTSRQESNLWDKRHYCRGAWVRERNEFGAGNRWMAYNAIQGAEQHRINGRARGGSYDPMKAMEKAIDNKTPLAERAMTRLTV